MYMIIGVAVAIAAIVGGTAAALYSQGATSTPSTSTDTGAQQPSKPLDEQISEVADTSKKELKVEVEFGDDPISQGETQTIDILVLDSETREPIRDASVSIRGTSAAGSLKTFNALTDRNGLVSFTWPIGSTSQTGDYEAIVRVSSGAYPLVSIDTGFEVISDD